MRWEGWLGTALLAAAVAMVVVGAAYASVNIAKSTQESVGEYASLDNNVTGVTGWSVAETTLPAAYAHPTGTAGAPLALPGTHSYCLVVACKLGDESAEFSFTYTNALTGSIQLPIALNIHAGGGTTTVYFKQAAFAVAGTIHLYWDLGARTSSLTASTFDIQQCHGAGGTCP
jgi:hypothetical protein